MLTGFLAERGHRPAVAFFCLPQNVGAVQPTNLQQGRGTSPEVMHAPFRIMERVRERSPKEVRALVSGD